MNPIAGDLGEPVVRHPSSDGSVGTEPRPSGSGRTNINRAADNRFLTGAARIAHRSTRVALTIALSVGWVTPASGQSPAPTVALPSGPVTNSNPASKGVDAALARLNARRAVHEGNRRLLASDATGALKAYRHAENQDPDASEIAFVEGLAHFDLKEYDQAREAFEASAATSTGRLANDARYSLGTCDHAEALDHLDDPQAALPLIEKAMRRYQGVLADDTEHEAARDAMLKAAAMRRRIKQQMQQQPQQQKSDDNQEKKDDQNQDQQQQSEGDQEKQDEKQQKKNEDAEQKPDDSSEKQEPSENQDQQEPDSQDHEQSSDEEEQDQQQEKEQPSKAQEEDQVSREQAERKLREMMQAIRDRKKSRREIAKAPAGVPVKKDW